MIRPDKIIRSSRRTLSLCVDSFGRLIVRAPKRYAEERIFAFIQEKEAWILKKQAERKGAGICLPPENLHGYAFPLIGRQTEIRLTEGKKILCDEQAGILYLPKEDARRRLVKWLKAQAKDLLTRLTEEESARMGVSYLSLSVTSAKSRWGSCSAKNALRYTYRLLYCPIEIIRYVVVHELAHVRYKNHSPAFWREVEEYLPDWKERRKWLKLHGIYMEIF